jgi:hypothetical protein
MRGRTALFRAVFYWGFGLGFVVFGRSVPPHPSPLPPRGEGKGSRSAGFSKSEFDSVKGSRFWRFSRPEFDSVSHVGVARSNTSVGSLSLWERARVRAVLWHPARSHAPSRAHPHTTNARERETAGVGPASTRATGRNYPARSARQRY